MKYLIATDLHGSAYWAERVLDKFTQTNAEVLVLLGDVYNHGPRNPFPQEYAPMRVADMLNDVADRLIVVQGNCDSEVDGMISRFSFVRENFIFIGGRRVLFTHGHIHNKDSLPPLANGDVLLYGHFHINEVIVNNGITCVNIASCSLPKQGAVPAYALLDDSGISLLDFGDGVLARLNF